MKVIRNQIPEAGNEMRLSLSFLVFGFCLLGIAATPAPSPTQPLTAAQQRGKAIYIHGESTAGRAVTAVLGDEGDGVPATIVPCANCHGEDGRGKPEGSVRPPDITPESLSRSGQTNGRTRSAYTRPLLKRAITMGFDSGRNELNAAMPRYRMAMQDAEDLLAYLEMVGHEPQPGVSSDVIRIKLAGDTGELHGAEIYGRRLEFVREGEALFTIDASDDPAASVAAAERDHIPTVIVHAPAGINPYTFVLTAGDDEQRAALHNFARGQDAVMIEGDCMASLARTAALTAPQPPPLVLMTAAVAKTCTLAGIPVALDRKIIVAAPLPPTPDATQGAAAVAVAITTNLLAQLGRDVTRAALVNALEHVHHVETRVLPPITWEANRHGTHAAWLMTVDLKAQRLLAEPGWVEGE
jgi:hypothetical protein